MSHTKHSLGECSQHMSSSLSQIDLQVTAECCQSAYVQALRRLSHVRHSPVIAWESQMQKHLDQNCMYPTQWAEE